MIPGKRLALSFIAFTAFHVLLAQEPVKEQILDSVEVTQDTLRPTAGKTYQFLDLEANRIHNIVSLSSFYEKLYRLRQGQNIQVNIIHLGDSHIQADFLTRVVRENFQNAFGNAGRGLIIPGRVAHTNQPSNLYSSSPSLWEVKRMVFPDKPLPIGIGGITLKTIQPQASFTIRTIDATPLSYRFNKVILFFQKDLNSFNIGIKDSINQDLAFVGPYTAEPFSNTSTVLLPYLAHQISFQMLPPTGSQNQFILFGIDLENDKPGVRYHAIGVNGAKFKHFTAASQFSGQAAALIPDLIIISLGTNEALDYPYSDPLLTTQMDNLIRQLKTNNPQAQFLFTILSDSYRRKTHRNPGVEIVRGKIIDYADKNNLAFWDLYTIGGGKHAADFWKKNQLMQRDGVHFTVKGYQLQGNLLYDALIKGFEEYVQYRHP